MSSCFLTIRWSSQCILVLFVGNWDAEGQANLSELSSTPSELRYHLQISLLILLNEFKVINWLLFPLKSSWNIWFSKGARSKKNLIHLNSFNVRSEIWMRSPTLLDLFIITCHYFNLFLLWCNSKILTFWLSSVFECFIIISKPSLASKLPMQISLRKGFLYRLYTYIDARYLYLL